jgi:DNA-binding transcriptional regulator YhcF (GntR family)
MPPKAALRDGDQLPRVRALGGTRQLSSKACSGLENEERIELRQGSGAFVNPHAPPAPSSAGWNAPVGECA